MFKLQAELLTKQQKSDLSKLKTFADGNLNVAWIVISVYDRVENIAGKWENACLQHFLLSQQSSQKASVSGLLNVGIVW